MKYTYLTVAILELFYSISLFFCRGGIGSGIRCNASVFSGFLETFQGFFELGMIFLGALLLLPLFIIIIAFAQSVQGIIDYRKENGAMRGFLKSNNRRRYALFFLLFQIPVFFLSSYASDIQEEERSQRVKNLNGQSTEIKQEVKQIYEDGQNISEKIKVPLSYVAPEPGSAEWISQVESRFTEYDLENNTLVLNDVIERFQKSKGKLPENAAELTSFVPSLKPQYKNETERETGSGWIYKVLYRKQTEKSYELCVGSTSSQPGIIDAFGPWQKKGVYYCVQRTL